MDNNDTTTRSGNPLWTKDFTIITLGSVVSMMGNAMTGFAMSLLVLDYTQSSLLYAIYLAMYTLPQIIMPIFSGAFLDRFSRKKMIYSLDYGIAALYAVLAFILSHDWFSFPMLAIFVFLIGSINSVYMVAYQSFYPLLISPGNFSKAYSVSSILETLSAVMIPVSTYVYNLVGIVPLLLINVGFLIIAATMETRIGVKEEYIELRKQDGSQAGAKQLLTDIKEGFRYLTGERALLVLAIYFAISSLAYGATQVISLPYFKTGFENGEYIYILVEGMAMAGRAIGGAIHYRIEYPAKLKYGIALAVYIITDLLEGFFLYMPVPVMALMMLMSGLLAVTSYTIRVAATQSYVPDEKKGRFNGAFNMLNTVGSFSGQLLAGALTVFIPERTVLMSFMMFCALMAVILIGGNKKHIEKIYNRVQ